MKMEVQSPWDGSILETFHLGDAEGVDDLLKRATGVLENCKAWLPAWERKDILLKTAADLKLKQEEFALTIAKEGGKPLVDAGSR